MTITFLLHHWFLICVVSQFLVGALFTYPVGLAYWRKECPCNITKWADVKYSALWALLVPWPLGALTVVWYMQRYHVPYRFMWRPE